MAKPRSKSPPEERVASPRELGIVARAVVVVCVALLVVRLFDGLGLVAAIDDALRERWVSVSEAVGNTRATKSLVILVAADEETVAHPDWGPPPWPAERLEQLLDEIDRAAPAPVLISEAGHTRMFERGPALDQIVAERQVLLARAGQDPGSPWVGGGLERGDLVVGPHGRAHAVARQAGLDPIGERLPVNWLVPASRLPVVPVHKVTSGDIPESSFSGRVVMLGITDPSYEMLLDTPIGRLSPAEIEAHALTGLADGVAWPDLPGRAAYGLCAGFALVLLWFFARLRGRAATLVVAVSTILVLVLDFVCYSRGWIRLGSGHALLTLTAVGSIYWGHEALETFAGLRQLRARVLRDATGGGSNSTDAEPEDVGFWEDLAELGSEYAQETICGAAAATIIERKDETWALRVCASARLDGDSHAYVAQREGLDLRRAPFRTPWLTLRAGWAADLVPAGPRFGKRKTLIVPLEDQGQLLGLWLVHVAEEVDVEHEHVETFERLGRQMAGALVRRRERIALRDQATNSRLRDHVGTIVGGIRLMRDEHRWALELLEQLPVRALIATVWGELEFIDPRLRDDLVRRYPGLFSPDAADDNLRTVLARLTGRSIEDASRLMRKVLAEDVEIELDAKPGIEDPGDDVWVLSRIRSKRGIDLPGFKPAVHEHILLMARSSAPAQKIRTRSGGWLRVLRGASGES